MMMILAAFLLTILVVVGIHELGHLWAAKLIGVRAENFAIGFGPELVGWTSKSGLRWSVKLLPLGGYVRFVGDGNAASLARTETGPIVPGSLRSVSPLKQAWVVAAGPGINLALTVFLFAAYLMIAGKPTSTVAWVHPYVAETTDTLTEARRDSVSSIVGLMDGSEPEVESNASDSLSMRAASTLVIGSVVPGSPASQSGLDAGDVILKLGMNSVSNWTYLQTLLGEADETTLTVWRDGEHIILDLDMRGAETLGVWE